MAHKLPKLTYAYDSLEPFIDARTMEIHHSKHHKSYVDKLNQALEGTDLENKPVEELLKDALTLPENKKQVIINNGGGHANHSFFWKILKKNIPPEGEIIKAINTKFNSFDKFKELFTESAISRFGSGWAWLVLNENKELEILSTPNQNSPLSQNKIPILGLDVWEHAYYLKYQNKRLEYIEAFWNIIDWEKVNENFLKSK